MDSLLLISANSKKIAIEEINKNIAYTIASFTDILILCSKPFHLFPFLAVHFH